MSTVIENMKVEWANRLLDRMITGAMQNPKGFRTASNKKKRGQGPRKLTTIERLANRVFGKV